MEFASQDGTSHAPSDVLATENQAEISVVPLWKVAGHANISGLPQVESEGRTGMLTIAGGIITGSVAISAGIFLLRAAELLIAAVTSPSVAGGGLS